ncbi:MAG TPA: Uma2 family endonuclease [Polyangiaceae bacterium]|nr:Uma2 family endonuclease [Polyangiaceae bacterium]
MGLTSAAHSENDAGSKVRVLLNRRWGDACSTLWPRPARSSVNPPRGFVRTPCRGVVPRARRGVFAVWVLDTRKRRRPSGASSPTSVTSFGHEPEPARPDLAIEVVWTSGGIRKLDIYAKLGVREVWFWRGDRIGVHVLRDTEYQNVATSELLPGIDLEELASFLDRPTASQAIRDYRVALMARAR